MPITLILGGARSGKSSRAEALATSMSEHPIYIATAPMIDHDHEWLARIEQHREERGLHWRVIEETLELTRVLQAEDGAESVMLIDCLTLWLNNLIFAGRTIEEEAEALCELLPQLKGEVILVANEVGMGLVPENEEGRAFRDAQGRLNQRLAATADRVEFVAAGIPLCLKERNN
ncbi:adenosylcobinamide kinase [Mariprofundus ferrinatatus]|uniref:Bifunctional adenosylcobalamin biosynthesis protein n=1 Tax=Mariprofundus ferrinatatus TaxID=1921087 RepID=A0A2K8L676_9PROT|nr:bifunctional adenosylcobinamide kinase/adenosylcobinamide-phosphate guanylyltransferase [Mariprofundus ferrinatatus]ATX82830.1 adenosylcobinamide kinase [Mariprofundus ferrinatatus]